MNISHENFVKTIYQIKEDQKVSVTSSRLAEKLNISNAAVTEMARKLAEKKLVQYQKYKELALTESGKQLALNVIRRHRLWETFLYEVLHLNMQEVHEEAEALEHQSSELLINRIEAFLKYPKRDPHGDPIPDKQFNMPVDKNVIGLHEVDLPGAYKVIRINHHHKELHEMLSAIPIRPTSEIRVILILKEAEMIKIEVKQQTIFLNQNLSKNIYVEKIK
jgi:DtxR family Mn-dependent transcriptional regulator